MADPRSKIKRIVTSETKNLIHAITKRIKEDADKSHGQLNAVFDLDRFKVAHEEFIEHIENEAKLEAADLYFDEVDKYFVDAVRQYHDFNDQLDSADSHTLDSSLSSGGQQQQQTVNLLTYLKLT